MVDAADVTLGDDNFSDAFKVCYITGVEGGGNEYSKYLGARISSVFVILFVSTFFTIFPLLATRFKKLRIPLYGYLFARYFGTGVIIATAYVHLMDPAYGEIGPNSCVGMTGNWAVYSWPPAIMLASIFFIFIVDIVSAVWVERKYGVVDQHDVDVEDIIVAKNDAPAAGAVHQAHEAPNQDMEKQKEDVDTGCESIANTEAEISFKMQFTAFLILEFGVIFHSVMIGLNLGAVDADEFKTLYIVLVFHQSFEGLGIGARLSAIPFPADKPKWIPWLCCIAYGLVTPVCVAIGLGVRKTYFSNSFNANIIQGVLDSISAGILMYTGLVELLARDFLFDPHRTKDLKRLTFMVVVTLLGAGIMALLGKWA
jgi:zinc transporter 1/2/3